ncbi:hypothetical protein DFP73DRAFT_629514 [Morchella snyderi]|nr:hypothetical protein DFP73DRAFT_629514 [Morchella snyderi]
MLLSLPVKLLERFIQRGGQAIFPLDGKSTGTVISLLRACRVLYGLVLPLLYHTLPLHVDQRFDNPLYPLHLPTARHSRGPFGMTPAGPHICVKHLLVLATRYGRQGRQGRQGRRAPVFPSRDLTTTSRALTCMQSLVYTAPRLVFSPPERRWTLEKVMLYDVDAEPATLHIILASSAATLQDLHMAYSYTKVGISQTGLPHLPELRALGLLNLNELTIAGLHGTVAFGRLKALEIFPDMVEAVKLCGEGLREAHIFNICRVGID